MMTRSEEFAICRPEVGRHGRHGRVSKKLLPVFEWVSFANPVQAEGVLIDGNAFMFRARHCHWFFGVGENLKQIAESYAARFGQLLPFQREGEDPVASWMPPFRALDIIEECAKRYLEVSDGS
jgi:hypothetical protein